MGSVSFLETVEQARAFLERNGRVSLRALKREFDLDDVTLEELAEELVDIQQVAAREGKAISWVGSALTTRPVAESTDGARSPRDYTPKHLAEKILQSKSALEGERKQVTVLFADVKGSMELAKQVDAERWHTILNRFFEILSEGVHRFEGTVNQYTGDGIMALFGAPIAHEDHAQRACYAALQLLDDLREFTREIKRQNGLDFAVRIGLNSGEVVVGRIGDDLRMDYTAQGHTVGLAQRMESLAEPNSCALSAETAAVASGYFDLEDLGAFTVKGFPDPLPVFALRGLGSARTRLDRSRARGFSKFVGRDREMEGLESALEEAIAGNGQVVGVVAEAGTGKSRLCLEFVERCRARGIRVDEAHCPAHGKAIPYLPLLEMLRSIFEIGERDGEHEARRKIAGELLLLDDSFQAMLQLLFDFLGFPDPARPAPSLSPENRQQQLFAFVRHLTRARSEREPKVMLLDDLHWIDAGSDAFLAHAVEGAEGSRTLWLVNFRPEYEADWMKKSSYRQIPLRPLGREAIDELLLDLLGPDPSVQALPEGIYARTGGNPFFVEEVVQSLVENGALEGAKGAYRLVTALESQEIPGTVQNVLAARIDRLDEREKHVLQAASVIAKEFPEPILKRVVNLPGAELTASLARLVQAEFLLETALYPQAEYAFKHPLTQEVAYHSQLATKRIARHAAVARAIEELEAEKLDEQAALLAYHWEAAGESATASRWHARAARSIGLDSPGEARRHWDRVWELVDRPPESDDAKSLLIEAAGALLRLGFRQGLSAEDAGAILAEGKALAVDRGDPRGLVEILYGYGVGQMLGGAPKLARDSFIEAIAVADATGDPDLRFSALEPSWLPYAALGDLEGGLRMSAELIEIAGSLPPALTQIGFSPAWAHGIRAWLLTDVGRFDQAAESLRRCEEGARRLDETEVLAWNDNTRSRMLARTGDPPGALAAAQRAEERAEKVGSILARVMSYEHQGLALVQGADWHAAGDRLDAALNLMRETGVWLTWEAGCLAARALVHLNLGNAEAARATAAEAIESAVTREINMDEIRAQLALARVLSTLEAHAARSEVESAIDRAAGLVQRTGARSLEPFVHEERAKLAAALGNASAAEHELGEARRLFTEMGATGHAARLAREPGS
jgi:class 3 adenylate cyclase/tetratricopeptide (TPR) repeat protein